jgi:hypothetical protein
MFFRRNNTVIIFYFTIYNSLGTIDKAFQTA